MAKGICGSDSSIQNNMDTIQPTFRERLRSCQNKNDVQDAEVGTLATSQLRRTSVMTEASEAPGMKDISYNERVFYIREIQESKSASTTNVRQYTITNETIKRAIEEQSKEDTCVVDKYLNIALRNLFGEFRNINLSDYDQQVNRVMKYWKHWCEESPRTRSTPLLYKCYKCKKGWWRLHPFREHLNQHKNVKLRTEKYKDELCVYACTWHESERKLVKVDSPCWRCGGDVVNHKIIDESVKYKCDVCKIQMSTCAKYKQHEITCLTNLQSKYNNDVQPKKKVLCNICGTCYIEYKQYCEHLIDLHSVRSDEPIAIDANACKLCGLRYVVQKFHDCPEKHKSFKCNSCSRKFTVMAMKNAHMQLSKGPIKCEFCGKQMVACMAPEHYLSHTKNYAAARICLGCENRVLFTKLRYHNAHMKHHNSHVSKKRWGSRMLFPKKCLNGEIVESEQTLTIPNDELDAFMYGLEGFSKSQANDTRANVYEKNANSVNETQLSKGSINPENIINQDPKIRALQEQLDAEILRDMQMEAAISEVFKASKSYRKFIEKEKMEQQYITKESIKKDLHTDGISSDNDLEIIETKDESFTLNDLECEAFEGNFQREELKSDDEEEDSLRDDIEEGQESGEVASDIDEDLEWIALSVAKERDMLIDTVKNEIGPSQRDEEAESNDITEQEHNQFKIIASPKKEVELDDKKNSAEETMENLDRLKCNKCHFNGDWQQYVVHGITWCVAAMFKCNPCDKIFLRLSHYLCHLVEHGHKKFACPVCSYRARLTFTFNKHVTSHIRNTFSEINIQALSNPSRGKFIFSCLKCGAHVELRQFFEHWQKHFDNKLVNVASESDMVIDTMKTEPELSQTRDGAETREQECSKMKTIGDNEEVELEADNNAKQTEELANRLHACTSCEFEGDWKRYVMHCIAHCAASDFGCDTCGTRFPSLHQYLDHLVEHGYKSLTCPMCLKTYKYAGSLYRHVAMHIRNTFSKEYVNDPSESSQDNFVFACLRCGLHVQLHQSFKHWSMHIHNIDVPGEMKSGQKSDDFAEKRNGMPQTIVSAKNQTRKSTDMELCLSCHFEGDWKQYVVHTARCAATEFKCNFCGGRFVGMQHYVNHLQDHGHESLTCLICDRHFQCPSSLSTHLTRHIIDNFSKDCIKVSQSKDCSLFTCLQCGDCVNLTELFNHWQNHFCINREKISYQSTEFDEAKQTMRPGIVEKVLRELRSRTRTTKEMHCDVCHEKFNLKNRYKSHLIGHLLARAMSTKEYQYDRQLKCYFCPEVLSKPTRWKAHMREHSSLPVYKCDQCLRVFNYASTRFKHKEVHAQRTFICNTCGTKFPVKRSLVNHFRDSHATPRMCVSMGDGIA